MDFGGMTLMLGLLLGGAAGGAPPALPADARLDPVRGSLQEIVATTSAAGLPADLLLSKVREGLAKGVDVQRIQMATARLAESLKAAHTYVAERRPGATPEPALLRAVAEAKMAGVDLAAADPVLRGKRSGIEAARAIEVMTDLSLRGYPGDRASAVVKEVLARDPGAVGRLPAALETIRTEQALTRAETVDALSRGLAGSDSLQTAYTRTMDDERRRGVGKGQSKEGEAHEAGKSGIIPPGLAKKQGDARPGRPRR